MKTNHKRFPLAAIMVLAIVVGFTGAPALAANDAKTKEDASLKAAVQPVEDYKTPGIEAELSGFYPHPTNSNLYYLLTNKRPPYRYGRSEEHTSELQSPHAT